mmetsp:Transcript_16494/g.25467  ORF Transcript_16494/g.25467 Transcript_16494/m.25467 type:complete len:116 (-) Transcript_16494:21-368(-)
MMSSTAKKSKYQTIIKTPEEVEAERIMKEMEQQAKQEKKQQMEDDDEVDITAVKKSYTVDDIVSGLDKQMKIVKKKKKADTEMAPTKTITKEKNSRNKVLKQKNKGKRSRSQLMF